MAYSLTQDELDEIPKWTNEKLLDQVEYFGDYKTLIETQDANGIAHKDDTDPDVVKMRNDYKAVRDELISRLKSQQEIDLLAEVESGSNQIALIGASRAGALGIPAHGNTPSQVTNVKTQYKSDREDLVTAIGI